MEIRHYARRIAEEPHRARFLASRALRHTRLCSILGLKIAVGSGQKINFHPAAIPTNLWLDPHFYDHATTFTTRYLRSGDVFVDVGANIGLHSIMAAAIVGKRGRVLSIEPHPTTAERLRANIALNPDLSIEIHEVAVGKDGGRVPMTTMLSDDQNFVGEGATPVECRPLDVLVPTDVEVDLMKIDIEGSEAAALEGAPSVLARTKTVEFEAHAVHARRRGYSLDQVFDLLHQAGFRIYRVRDDEFEGPVEGPTPEMRENLIAARSIGDVSARTLLEPRS